nr:lipase, GDSL [Tanacetum cinerariifolium]
MANFWPYGESYFTSPTGRFSNGRLIPDFIAEYARLPLIPPYLEPGNNEFMYGANFASAGAGVLIDTKAGFVVDLQTQLRYLGDVENKYRENLGDTGARQLLSSAVYLFSCGINDYVSFVGSNVSNTDEQYTDMVIGSLTTVIKGIYAKGGRKFGFVTVPLLGCSPGFRISQPGNICNKRIDDIARLHNRKFAMKLEHLQKQLDGFMYAKFDISAAIINRMNNPSEYANRLVDSLQRCFGKGIPSKLGFLVLFVFCLWVPTDSWGNIDKRVALFVFGDSLFDPGNNNYINTTTSYQANFWPYGESYFNPPTGRFSNGRLIPDFIAEYARLPLIPPYLKPGNKEF